MVIIAVGLLIEKVHAGIRTKKYLRHAKKVQVALSEYLFADIADVDPVVAQKTYRRQIAPLLQRFRASALEGSWFNRKVRRMVVRDVMLDVSQSLTGETEARLAYAFQGLGFVQEEMKNTSSPQWWIRANACRNLRIMRADNICSPQLSQLLNDPHEDVRNEAAQSLVDILGVEALATVLSATTMSPWMEVRLSKSILRFGSSAIPYLTQGLSSASPRIQKFCVEMMGYIGDVQAVPLMVEYIDHEILEVQCASLRALGKLGDDRAISIILRYVESDKEQLRIAAAKALGSLASPATAESLNALLMHDTIEVRLAAAESLTRLGEIGARTLIYSTRTEDETTKLAAYQFLHELGYEISEERA